MNTPKATSLSTLLSNPRQIQRVTIAAVTACAGLFTGLSQASDATAQVSLQVAESNLTLSTAIQTNAQGKETHYYISNHVIVKIDDQDYLNQMITMINQRIPGVQIAHTLDADGTLFAISTPTIGDAQRVAYVMSQSDAFDSVRLDMKEYDPALIEHSRLAYEHAVELIKEQKQFEEASGVSLVGDLQTPRGGAAPNDPLYNTQWIHDNTLLGTDNNIPPSVYDVSGITGAGVNVGISTFGINQHLDIDQPDLVLNYSPNTSMVFDPNLFADNLFLTAAAGVVAGERNNSLYGHGIAPGARVSTFNYTGTDLTTFQAFDWKNNEIDVKAFRTLTEYLSPQAQFVPGRVSGYVTDALENSIRFGRQNKGVVNIFGTNGLILSGTMPDPYNFPPMAPAVVFSEFDEWLATGNTVQNGVNFGYSTGPYYPTAQTNFYPHASNRRALVINNVSEDGFADVDGGIGANVFASVWGASINTALSITPPRTITTIAPGQGPADTTGYFGNETGPVIAAGIVALLLEANPNLSARDIQHVLFRSIQESTGTPIPTPPANIWPQFNAGRNYIDPFPNPFLTYSFWQVNSGLYNSDNVTNQAIRHSDVFGFGMINVELAIEIARNYGKSPKLFLLDTGIVGDVNDGIDRADDPRMPVDVVSPEFNVIVEADGSTGTDGSAVMNPVDTTSFWNVCIRQNISIESVVLELTIAGLGSNDLFIELVSPSGTRSVLAMPTTNNTLFASADPDNFADDESDLNFDSGVVNGTAYAYYQHPFLSWKHWGELSGGRWTIQVYDFGPDDVTPEGEPAGTGPMADPGADVITTLGPFGIPGSNLRTDKEVTAFRLKVYGTDVGEEIFLGCNPNATSCPGDLDGNGIINLLDLQIFLSWFTNGNAFADMNDDGVVSIDDLFIYRGLWSPGFCNGGNGFVGGRPHPGTTNANGSDNNPVIRPI